MPVPEDDAEVTSLIYRYLFSRIFGKLYFGAGFGQLSLIAGYHHLLAVYALLKLQSKALARLRGADAVGYLDLLTAVRQLEKRLGETSLDGMAAATYEWLLYSPMRAARLLAHS